MNKEKIEYYAHLTITISGIIVLLALLLRYLFIPILPFLIAWLLATALTPLSSYLYKRICISKRIIRAVLATLCAILLVGALIFGAFYILNELWWLISGLLSNEGLGDVLSKITNPLASLIGEGVLSEDIEEYLNTTIREALSGVLSSIVGILGRVVSASPSVMLFVLVTIIATIYFSYELERINNVIKKLLPKQLLKTAVKVKTSLLRTGGKYIRSYLILTLITYFAMLLGFMLLRV